MPSAFCSARGGKARVLVGVRVISEGHRSGIGKQLRGEFYARIAPGDCDGGREIATGAIAGSQTRNHSPNAAMPAIHVPHSAKSVLKRARAKARNAFQADAGSRRRRRRRPVRWKGRRACRSWVFESPGPSAAWKNTRSATFRGRRGYRNAPQLARPAPLSGYRRRCDQAAAEWRRAPRRAAERIAVARGASLRDRAAAAVE